jgi:uncharacterized membrane protein YphA (DoxX/SURF4 family)
MTAMASTTRTKNEAPVTGPGGVRGFLAGNSEWISLVARLLLAAMWLFYSLPKLTSPEQNAQSVRNFQILPESLVKPFAFSQPWLEMAFGILLILGLGTRLVALFSALLLLTYIGGIISLGARGIHITCGCGGGGEPLAKGQKTTYTWDVFRDVSFMLPALWLLWKPASKLSLERALLGDPIE